MSLKTSGVLQHNSASLNVHMKLRQFQAVRAVVMTGSITDAAELLSVTQPAVSKLVAQVEGALNVRVFDRRHGRLVLTPEGKAIYGDIERILSIVDDIVAKTSDVRELNRTHLRLGAMPALCVGLLPRVLRRMLVEYPQLKCSVEEATRSEIEDMVNVGKFDIGLVTLPIQHDRLECDLLGTVAAVCVVPLGHPLAQHPLIDAKALANEHFVSVEPSWLLRHRIDTVFAEERVARRLQVQVTSTQVACQMVAAGVGVSIVHPLVALGFSRSVCIRQFSPKLEFEYALLRRSGSPTGMVSRFGEIAREEMGNVQHQLNAAVLTAGQNR
jgi:DNA-binding transcriptional LysR family regulator